MIPALKSYEDFRQRYGVRHAGSIERVGDSISKKLGPYRAEAKGARRRGSQAEFATCASADLTLNLVNWGAPMVGTALEDHNRFCISVSLEGYAETLDPFYGPIRPGPSQARVFGWSPGTQTLCNDHNTVLNFSVPHALLQARAQTFYGRELNDPLRFEPLLDLNNPGASPLLCLINYLKVMFTETPDVLSSPVVAASIREHALSIILGDLAHNYRPQGTKAVDTAIPKQVRRAEELMRAHADQPLTVKMLAQEARCSERALHSGFRQFRQATPMEVLRDLRLERARQDLQQAAGSVTACALKWGFTNVGRFARLYQERFDEKPSDTLRFPCSRKSAEEPRL